MEQLKHDTAAAIDFLRRWSPGDDWCLTAIIPDGKTETRTFRPSEADAAADWIEGHQGKRNLYFHVNPVRRPLDVKASKEDMARLVCLHVDIDPRAGEDPAEEKERALKLLRAYTPKPTVIVDSGGGVQALWKLDPSDKLEIGGNIAKAQELEAYNIQLEKVFQADHCHNCDRILRLVGTINVPTAKKAKKGRKPALARLVEWHDASYPIEQFTPAVRVQTVGDALPGGRPKVKITGNVPDVGTDELKAWAAENGKSISDHCLALIATGQDPLDPTKYPSRSEALFKVCCDLVRAEVPDEMIFAVITGSNEIAASVRDKPNWEGYALRQIERAHEEAIDPWLRRLNEKYAVILDIGGKCRIIREVWDPAMKRTRISKQSFEDFRNGYRNRKVIVAHNDKGQPVEKAVGVWWVDHPQRRQYDTIVFAPGQEVEDAYNLWRGFAVDSLPGDKHQPFLRHVRENVCSGNDEWYGYLLGWMARAVQHPDTPGEVAVVLRGKRGTGKSFFAKMFGRLFGRHFLQVSDSKHLVGSFNAHLRDTVLLFGDEAFFAGDKKHESVLKTLVTEEQLVIEGKGVDAEAAANFTHLVLASNEDWVVPAGLEERRFFALDMADDHMQDNAYFKAIRDELEAGGFENLLHFLRTYDLSNFEVRKAPKTQALRDQQAESLRGFEAYVFDLLWSGEEPEGTVEHPNGGRFALTTPMRESATEWLKANVRITSNKIQAVLEKKLGATKDVDWSRGKNGLNGYYWDLEALRAAWNKSMFPVDWPHRPEKKPAPF
ncbi:hypothetical protein GCM10022279_28210 [Comamonas faecalis]|uniref:NrS-1 polymerase-like helicase domain-containing protein n=1 Tax=Comamonas faecalis TaxID=1387849 RepID=A0ABP7RV42_9BURK